MPLCRIGDTVLYFAHIPKTGGSSIEAYMAAKGPVALRYNSFKDWSRTTPQHMPARVFADYVPDAFYDHGFAVLRDPVARILSTFRMRIGDDHDFRNPLNWVLYAWARARGKRPFAIRVLRWKLSLDFDTWVIVMAWLVRRRPYLYDGHCLPQADYVHPGHRLFLFEDGIAPVFRWIDAVTGTPALPGDFHEKKARAPDVTVSPAAERRLRALYAADAALIADLRAARAADGQDAGAGAA